MSYITKYLSEVAEIIERLDTTAIERMVKLIIDARARGGRLFILGVGGGAGHASHAVCDFRKIAGMEAYAPSDNVSELTARVNDEGWETAYAAWLAGSRLRSDDLVLVFSVGGGDLERNISRNLVRALEYSRDVGAKIVGVVGRSGGYTAKVADACVVVPTVNAESVTPHTETLQAVIWHLLVSHPDVQIASMKWESVQ
jgi:D-sedoheptulose 7-phosphate isomerase